MPTSAYPFELWSVQPNSSVHDGKGGFLPACLRKLSQHRKLRCAVAAAIDWADGSVAIEVTSGPCAGYLRGQELTELMWSDPDEVDNAQLELGL